VNNTLTLLLSVCPQEYGKWRKYYFEQYDAQNTDLPMGQTLRRRTAAPRIWRNTRLETHLNKLHKGKNKDPREGLIIMRQINYHETFGVVKSEAPPWRQIYAEGPLTDDVQEVKVGDESAQPIDLCDSDDEVIGVDEFIMALVEERGFITTEVKRIKPDPDAAAQGLPQADVPHAPINAAGEPVVKEEPGLVVEGPPVVHEPAPVAEAAPSEPAMELNVPNTKEEAGGVLCMSTVANCAYVQMHQARHGYTGAQAADHLAPDEIATAEKLRTDSASSVAARGSGPPHDSSLTHHLTEPYMASLRGT